MAYSPFKFFCPLKPLAMLLLFCSGNLLAQISTDSLRKEEDRIQIFSRYQSIDFFVKAGEFKKTVRKGDLVVLQDESLKLYHGIIDSVQSLGSISIVLYEKPGNRGLVKATYEDLHILRPEKPKDMNQARFSEDDFQELEEKLKNLEKKLKLQEAKILQGANYLEEAGRAYENADIMRYVSYASLFLGSVSSAAGGLSKNSSLQTSAGVLIATSLGTGIAAVVYRFKGHKRLKSAGPALRR